MSPSRLPWDREPPRGSSAPVAERFFDEPLALLCVVDDRYRFLRVGAAWERLLGVPREQLVGRSYVSFVHPEDRERFGAAEAGGEPGAAATVAHRVLRDDGSERWLRWTTAWREGEDHVYAVAVDVSRLQECERELRRVHQLLASAEEVAGVGSFDYELDSGAISWSPGMHRLFGLAPGSFGGRLEDYLELVDPAERETVQREIAELRRTGLPRQWRSRSRRADGSELITETEAQLLVEESGVVVVGICREAPPFSPR